VALVTHFVGEVPAGDWCWMKDDKEAYVPATIQVRRGGRIQYKTLAGDTKMINDKGYQHIPLNMISLNKRVDDLVWTGVTPLSAQVMLDDMNEALILHTLKQRCATDSIYVQ
jgi:hypothetical protein